MDAIILQILNGLDKGSAYALIALGLTLIFRHLGRGQLRPWRTVHDRRILRGHALSRILSLPTS